MLDVDFLQPTLFVTGCYCAKSMDLLAFHPDYKVVVCRRCQYAVVPKEIPAPLRTLHKDVEDLTGPEIRKCAQTFLTKPVDLPETTGQLQVPPDTPAIPFLALYHDGFSCRLCPSTRPYVCRTETVLTEHLRQVHQCSHP
jgi:hypothetical protein